MCNIAGYVGTRPAAPILADMMRRQEGWDCGHYTGMATLDNGKLYMKKVIGDMSEFDRRVSLEELPGTIGFAHGRTPGCDGERDDRWGHPFLGTGGRMAYIVNGAGGVFKGRTKDLRNELYTMLREKGYRFETLSEWTKRANNQMPDGYFIHSSDLMTQIVQYYTDTGMDILDAMEMAGMQRPSERVALCLTEDTPDCISWFRMNYPMFTGVADHGMYMATTPQAMPEDARNIEMVMPLSVGKVYRDRIETRPILSDEITIAPITPGTWKACYEAMDAALGNEEIDHDSLDRLIRPLFAPATCPPESAVNYAIMNQFEKEGRLEVSRYRVPGTGEGLTAPKLKGKLK